MSSKPAPNISSLDLLRSLYNELSANFEFHYKTIIRISWRDGSPDTEEFIIHRDPEIPESKLDRKNYRGCKNVVPLRTFQEFTSGSLYSPVSALGYRNFSYEWALAFVIDCNLARQKTGNIDDALVHYISDVAAGDAIRKRRIILEENSTKRRQSKPNSEDLDERYLQKMKNLSVEERKEIKDFIKKNKKKLDSDDSFQHEEYRPKIFRNSVSISAGPDDLDDENFLSWLVEKENNSRKTSKKPSLETIDGDF